MRSVPLGRMVPALLSDGAKNETTDKGDIAKIDIY